MVGKKIRGALYIHRSAAHLLGDVDQERVRRAAGLVAPLEWNVARLEAEHIGLLLYEAFFERPFPALQVAIRVDLASGNVQQRTFNTSANPLILHRKELLLDPTEPAVEGWRQLTAQLEAKGLFRDNHLIGRQRQWAARLASAGFRLEGHRLCPL